MTLQIVRPTKLQLTVIHSVGVWDFLGTLCVESMTDGLHTKRKYWLRRRNNREEEEKGDIGRCTIARAPKHSRYLWANASRMCIGTAAAVAWARIHKVSRYSHKRESTWNKALRRHEKKKRITNRNSSTARPTIQPPTTKITKAIKKTHTQKSNGR